MIMSASYYLVFCALSVFVLKHVNTIVYEPYMDEPFHVPQAQAYCAGQFDYWDPKITTPPGLYLTSLVMKKIFMLKCNLSMLRLTVTLTHLALPLVLTRLLCFHKRLRPPLSIATPTPDAIVLAAFPIAWFYGFLYYTDLPSLLFVVAAVAEATASRHWRASLLGLLSCTFRQTNIVWAFYAWGASELMRLRFARLAADETLHDPPALEAGPGDLFKAVRTAPRVIPLLFRNVLPYTLILALFGAFVVWNGGIAMGDKSHHTLSFHIPQLYYFVAAASFFGWPALISGGTGVFGLARDVAARMFGTPRRIAVTVFIYAVMASTVYLFTLHHPFVLSDNRHYTFYVWRRIYMLHPSVPYVLIPGYIACAWAWFLRVGADQTLLQTLLLPISTALTLIPTPLLEPRYFITPYVLLRAQVADVPAWGLILELLWYAAIDAVTMWVFLFKEREGVGRFLW